MIAQPQNTHAIVIGAESYQIGSHWNLDGPAPDACKFVDWLCGLGVPAHQIDLFVSALPENEAAVAECKVKAQTASYELISRAMTDGLREKSGDLLVLFWGGHGVVDAQNSRRLFCADATEANPRHISINSLLTTWRTDTIGYFPRQIGFIDACQNYQEYVRIAASLPENLLPSNKPVSNIEQYILLGASVGQRALNLTTEKAGAFSQALMQELENMGPGWPPDMKGLNERLMERFTAARAAGVPAQTPSHYWYRDWKGGEGVISSYKRKAPANAGGALQLSNEQRDQLVLLLLEMDVMANVGLRESVIRDLRKEIQFNTPRNDRPRFDVDNLVKTSLKYPGGLKELIHTIKRFEGSDTIEWQAMEELLSKLPL